VVQKQAVVFQHPVHPAEVIEQPVPPDVFKHAHAGNLVEPAAEVAEIALLDDSAIGVVHA